MHRLSFNVFRCITGISLFLALPAWVAAEGGDLGRPVRTLVIPRIDQAPKLEDFLDMKPNAAVEGKMAKVTNFIQRIPRDGDPVSQHTEAYLAYDDENFYAVFIAFDAEPEKIRARMTPRENFRGDDKVDLFLDTFHDQRRSYVFTCNPLGVQMDGRWRESAKGPTNFDSSFDTIWQSKAKMTDRGYVVWMAVPFQSLRFPSTPAQEWGIVMIRWIPRNNESSTWPHVSTRIEGRLNQGATLQGIENVSPGRSIQLIPFGFARSVRSLDERDPGQPNFVTDNLDPDAGLDAKFVLSESFALDVALNPDFSQVESDEPQVTVNQRFEVFFPEKRPFFLENQDFFETPLNLFFSRRIADPQFGIRLTGKKGPYSLGALVADDEAPGKAVLPSDPLQGKRAKFAVLRVNRDIFRHSTIGMIYTDREFNGASNRVGGLDGRLKFGNTWTARFQGVTSSTRFEDGTTQAGPAYNAEVRREGRQFRYRAEYIDISPGFHTESGFVNRTDIRIADQVVSYHFRPEGKHLISWGPSVRTMKVWDHSGTRLDWLVSPTLSWEFYRQTVFTIFTGSGRERLRPDDFAGLPGNRDFTRQHKGLSFRSQYIPQINVTGAYSVGKQINLVPPDGEEPFLADLNRGRVVFTLRPNSHLRNDNTYILERLTTLRTGESIFNNHIIRSKWNWQFNRKLSLRAIFQYNAVLANSERTALETSKNFNADFLVTYLVNPWTALYVGYNGNLQNIELLPTLTGSEIVRTQAFMHDARQFFVKFSYLLRF